MNRRQFLTTATLTAASAPLAHTAAPDHSRIACTTTTFRDRFPQMSLLDVPRFFSENLGVTNVEIWSRHFTDHSHEFCAKLKAAADANGSTLINIQLDEPGYNLSDPDPARRAAGIATVKAWMDRAKICGATSLRANTGGNQNKTSDLATTADSFAQLAAHGATIGVKILIENHGGYSAKADNIVAIIGKVASPWCRSLPDFGNFDGTQEERHAFLRKLLPHAHLISTKGKDFDEDLNHSPYDIGACVRLAEASGYTGLYSIEQWSPNKQTVDDLTIAKQIRKAITRNLRR